MRHPRIAIMLSLLYVFFIGCQSAKESSCLAEDISSYRGKKITSLTLKNGETYRYDKVGGRYVEERRDTAVVREIVGFDPTGLALNFEISRILEIQCQTLEADGAGSALTAILAVAGGILIIALIATLSSSRGIATF